MIHLKRFAVGFGLFIFWGVIKITMPLWILPVLMYEEGMMYLEKKKNE